MFVANKTSSFELELGLFQACLWWPNPYIFHRKWSHLQPCLWWRNRVFLRKSQDISKHVCCNQKGEDAPSRNIQLESVVLQDHRELTIIADCVALNTLSNGNHVAWLFDYVAIIELLHWFLLLTETNGALNSLKLFILASSGHLFIRRVPFDVTIGRKIRFLINSRLIMLNHLNPRAITLSVWIGSRVKQPLTLGLRTSGPSKVPDWLHVNWFVIV